MAVDGIARRWVMPVFVAASLVAIAGIRVGMWPCGAFDRVSGCKSRVALDLHETGLDPAAAEVDWRTFDLGPSGKTALVGAVGPVSGGWRGVLGLFDTRTGKQLRLIHAIEHSFYDDAEQFITEAALSRDGSLVAMSLRTYDGDDADVELFVFEAETGKTVGYFEAFEAFNDCTAMLDFSPDGTKLQCSVTVYDLVTGERASALDGNGNMQPMYADFPPGNRAADGTEVAPYDLPAQTELSNSADNMHFAPDSVGLLEVLRAYRELSGARWWTPAPFRELSAVGVWDGQTKTLLRRFRANERYMATAWARDGSHFGFVSEDFHLSVFQR
jgi:hypothetical protein